MEVGNMINITQGLGITLVKVVISRCILLPPNMILAVDGLPIISNMINVYLYCKDFKPSIIVCSIQVMALKFYFISGATFLKNTTVMWTSIPSNGTTIQLKLKLYASIAWVIWVIFSTTKHQWKASVIA